MLIAGRLRYHEADELRASVRRNIVNRRARGANNVAVRRASRAMAKAHTLAEVFAAVEQVLALGEFVYVSVQLGRGGDAEGNDRALERERDCAALRGAEMRGGLIHGDWERGDARAHEVIDSHLFWTMRLPLSTDASGWGYITFYREFAEEQLLLDVNYLSGFFQREMAQAAERVFVDQPRLTSSSPELARLGVSVG